MSVLIVLLVLSISLGATFLLLFVRSVRSGQYEDTITPAMRILTDDEPQKPPVLKESKMKKMRST